MRESSSPFPSFLSDFSILPPFLLSTLPSPAPFAISCSYYTHEPLQFAFPCSSLTPAPKPTPTLSFSSCGNPTQLADANFSQSSSLYLLRKLQHRKKWQFPSPLFTCFHSQNLWPNFFLTACFLQAEDLQFTKVNSSAKLPSLFST